MNLGQTLNPPDLTNIHQQADTKGQPEPWPRGISPAVWVALGGKFKVIQLKTPKPACQLTGDVTSSLLLALRRGPGAQNKLSPRSQTSPASYLLW